MRILKSALIASIVLSACQQGEQGTDLSSNEDRINELSQELRESILIPGISSIEASEINTDYEKYIDGSREAEKKLLKSSATLLGDLMLKTYINKNSPVVSQTNLDSEVPANQEFRILRDAHPKGHQCLQASIEVKDNELFSDGLFGEAATYPAVLRVSSSNAEPVSDDINDVRGLAVKIDPQGMNHDLVMLSADIFPTDDAKQFTSLVKVARYTSCVDGISKIFSCISESNLGIRDIPAIASAARLFLGLQANSKNESPFEKTFFGVSSYRYADGTVFKYELSPCTPGSYSLNDNELDTKTGKSNLEDHIKRVLTDETVCYKVNLVKLPESLDPVDAVETHTKTWDKLANTELPRIEVAEINIGSQEGQSISALECDNLQNNPTNLSEGFEGLGSLNRARKEIYRVLSEFRLEANDRLRQ